METSGLRDVYECERDRLNLLCEKWQTIMDRNSSRSLSEDTKGTILSVLGQTRLLLNKKMKQFEGLLSDSARESGDTPPITLQDLEGFWELIMIQVNDLQLKFKSLDELNLHGECHRIRTPQQRPRPQPRYR
uniref:Uncharacterized protein n=1 Tax=Graphocephala atropunctata TaxID=36148 RepID=A0A1B6MDI6_9HEMI